ncbi:hypothetical protein D0Z00_003183 [Geotrichum galactomycetum]|uniref:Uncharacterized protein n=1 Tax=Geotrichum galactomycetum TaxID=27317 RepID=A0ACB6V228_9ASCO|nr:hypothetical protein D0Z00_003183 [Geotrichum candidum]
MPAHSYERLDSGADSNNTTVFEVPSELQVHGDDENDNLHNHAVNDHANEELDHLVDAFDGSSDSDIDDSDWDDDRQIDQSDDDDIVDTVGTSASATVAAASSSASSHTTSQPPGRRSLFSFLPWRTSGSPRGAVTINSQNDGVFSNITAKPETDSQSEDFPPTYEEASSDQAPPYWETTIMTPGFGDEIFIEGLPVGSPINFVWNMMVSSAFQFVGFLLTYLLHTSHAAKQGSRAGLGFTLFQYGFYLKPNAAGDSTAPAKEFEPSRPNDYEISSTSQDMSGSFHQDAAASGSSSSSIDSTTPDATTGWISIFLIVLGGIIIVKALLDYAAVRKMEQVIEGRSTTAPIEDEENEDTRSDRSVRV